MKSSTFFLLLILSVCQLFAQENKGRLFVETGVKVFGGEDYRNFIGKTGFSFFQHEHEYVLESPHEVESVNGFSYSIAPRVGYFVGNKFSAGLDFQYFHKNWWMEYQNYTGGIFARYYFIVKKFLPFIELGGGLGKSKETEDSMAPGGGKYQLITKDKLTYLNSSLGASYEISHKFVTSMAFKYQVTTQRFDEESNYGTSDYKKTTKEFVPFLSFSYFFN